VWETRVWRRHGRETAARTLLISQNVPQRELTRVPRWIRRARAARGRAVPSFLRHYVTGWKRAPGAGPGWGRSARVVTRGERQQCEPVSEIHARFTLTRSCARQIRIAVPPGLPTL
jgi:hypothetical protein